MIGEKIFIRESNFDDCKYFARWESEPKVTEFFTIDDGKNYEDTVKEFFKRMEDYTKRQFTVCLTETGEPIGRVYIGKGYGEEMLRLLLKWAFVDMGCERVTLDHFTGNIIARKLYEKIGFVSEGVMRHSGKKNGKYVDLCLMSILKDEYFK